MKRLASIALGLALAAFFVAFLCKVHDAALVCQQLNTTPADLRQVDRDMAQARRVLGAIQRQQAQEREWTARQIERARR